MSTLTHRGLDTYRGSELVYVTNTTIEKNTCKSRRFLPHSNQSDRVLSASLFSTSVNNIIYCWKNVSQDGKKSPSNALLTPQAFVSSGRVIWTLKIVKIIFIFIKLR